jgi:mannose-1-phosphate guanylyltransferase
MKAIILAAGYGSRLRPLTDTIPKCLVPIKGKPLLEIWLEQLSLAGITSFLINTHYLAKKVEDFIEKNKYKDKVRLVHEPTLKGTAGTLIANLDFYEDTDGILIHADNYCLADLNAFKCAHLNRPAECLMTMMIFRTTEPSTCGVVELDKRGVVVGFHEKVDNPPSLLANGAIYILSFELMNILGSQMLDAEDFSKEVIGNLVGKIFTYETKEIFIDIGKPDSYNLANNLTI